MIFLSDTDTYLRKFQKLVKNLKDVADQHESNASTFTDIAAEHQRKAEVATAESKRARNIAKKIEDLIS